MITTSIPAALDLSSTDELTGLPPGLTAATRPASRRRLSPARSPPARSYAHPWGQWERWCAARGIRALPGDPLVLCEYLTARAAEGRAMGTLDLACVAIRHVHRGCGAADPVATEVVRQVLLGLRRTHGGTPRRLARPLTVPEIRRIVDHIDRTTPIGARDAAIIMLGYASAMRRCELVALTLADVVHKPAGLVLTVRRSKTDQIGDGQLVPVAHGQHARTDPVAALAAWRAVRGEAPGPLFTRIWASSVSLMPLSGHVVARRLRALPKPPDSTGRGSPPTPCAPATPPPPPWRVSRCTASPRRLATRTSPSSSIATSARWRRLPRRQAGTSGSERRTRSSRVGRPEETLYTEAISVENFRL